MQIRNKIRLLGICLAVCSVTAQNKVGRMTGIVTDTRREPLEGVTVVLKNAVDSAYITGTVTDSCGRFLLPALSFGRYQTEFSMVGYKKRLVDRAVKGDETLDPVVMEEETQQLAGVVVTGKRMFMEIKPGTLSFDMDAALEGAEGTLWDALRSLPGVMVNEDGTVLLNGQTGIQVLVNGKSTYLTGDKLVDYLRSVPVSAVKNIELITSPSAKYDAAGKTGLIDIRTRKVMIEGWTLQANTGYRQAYDGKWNAGGRFTYQKNKLGLFADYSHSQGRYKSTLDIIRTFMNAASDMSPKQDITQHSRMKDHNRGDWARIGLDYDLSQNVSFEVSNSGTLFDKRIPGHTSAAFQGDRLPVDSTLYTQSFTRTRQRALSGGMSLNYKHGKGGTAGISFDYLLHRHASGLSMRNEMRKEGATVFSRDTLEGDMNSHINMYAVQADGSLPLPAKLTFDGGVKLTWVNLENKTLYAHPFSGVWLTDHGLSNRYAYRENIRAAYVQVNAPVGRFHVQAGLRLEQTEVGGTQYPSDTQQKDSGYADKYVHLFPSLAVQYAFPSTGNRLAFSYNKRIVRPNYGDLSPFNYIWDDYTRSTGNPNLRAELTDYLEVAYIHGKICRATLFFSYTKGPIMQHIELSDDNVAVLYPENFKVNCRVGLRLDASDLVWTTWWRMGLNATVYYSRYNWKEAENTIGKELFTPTVSLQNRFFLPAGIQAEISGFYNGRMAFGQATVDPHGALSVALRKKVWDDRLTLRVYADDLFQSNRQNLHLDLPRRVGKAVTRQFNDYRCIGLSVSIQLNQGKQTEKNRRDRQIDESKRINL